LAIDLGTSGPKVGLVSELGAVLGYEFEETPLILLPHGGAEERSGDWWEAIDQCVRRLLDRDFAPREQVGAVVCTGQWSGTVAVDSEGRPLMNAITWMDSRGQSYAKKFTGGLIKIEGYGVGKILKWLRKTGGIPSHSGKDSISHILYIQHELPEIYEKTACFLEPKDYLNLCLTGHCAASYDSMALHWITDNRDINNIDYDDGLIRAFGVDRGKLPDLKGATDILGSLKPELAERWGLSKEVQVVMGTPDVHSATIGSGAVRDFDTHLYVGTSSWITCHVPRKKTDIIHQIAALPAAIPGRYMLTNEQESAGSCLTFARDILLGGEQNYRELNDLAAKATAGSDKVIFTPWLYGERAPVSDRTIRGG
ncbi:MAG: FGGY-family carbohydrate kinase, partial [Candidatus Omnitrophica bacterium]|nr:FGGY-family carbohydrate kinase [Candidatus Omnitrophota bacterium]